MNDYRILIGSFKRDADSDVLYCSFEADSGIISVIDKIPATTPSWITFSENGEKIVYVHECNENKGCYGGAVCSARISKNSIEKIGELNIGSKGPTHVTECDGFLFLSCYAEGSVVQARMSEDGKLVLDKTIHHKGKSLHPIRQSAPHPHFSIITPDRKYLLVCDLGMDKIVLYPYDKTNGISDEGTEFQAPPLSGPRHAVFSKCGKFLYVVSELSGEILVYSYRDGTLGFIKSVGLPSLSVGVEPQGGAITLRPDGKVLLATNRGRGTIDFFDVSDGENIVPMDFVRTGFCSRDTVFSPNGDFIISASQNTDEIYVYSYDSDKPVSSCMELLRVNKLDDGFAPCRIIFE